MTKIRDKLAHEIFKNQKIKHLVVYSLPRDLNQTLNIHKRSYPIYAYQATKHTVPDRD